MHDENGALVVEYWYDAWGKEAYTSILTSAYEQIARLNPFRYRGYMWDEETGLYYLRSRYYNPVWERYLIGDFFYSTGQGILCSNRYSYCANNPVITVDFDGALFMLLTAAIGAVVGAIAGGIIAAVNDEDIVKGALVGAAIGGAVGLVGGAAVSLVTTGSALSSTSVVVGAVKGTAVVGTGVNSVYVSYNSKKIVQYVGVTNNMIRRGLEHFAKKACF